MWQQQQPPFPIMPDACESSLQPAVVVRAAHVSMGCIGEQDEVPTGCTGEQDEMEAVAPQWAAGSGHGLRIVGLWLLLSTSFVYAHQSLCLWIRVVHLPNKSLITQVGLFAPRDAAR